MTRFLIITISLYQWNNWQISTYFFARISNRYCIILQNITSKSRRNLWNWKSSYKVFFFTYRQKFSCFHSRVDWWISSARKEIEMLRKYVIICWKENWRILLKWYKHSIYNRMFNVVIFSNSNRMTSRRTSFSLRNIVFVLRNKRSWLYFRFSNITCEMLERRSLKRNRENVSRY
jgi:hypothetical protein